MDSRLGAPRWSPEAPKCREPYPDMFDCDGQWEVFDLSAKGPLGQRVRSGWCWVFPSAAAQQKTRRTRRDGAGAERGFGQPEKFLALDHIDGDGRRQPGVRRGGNRFYAWLIKQG